MGAREDGGEGGTGRRGANKGGAALTPDGDGEGLGLGCKAGRGAMVGGEECQWGGVPAQANQPASQPCRHCASGVLVHARCTRLTDGLGDGDGEGLGLGLGEGDAVVPHAPT